jgi:hypothetical protein
MFHMLQGPSRTAGSHSRGSTGLFANACKILFDRCCHPRLPNVAAFFLADTDGEAAADPTALKGVAVAWGPSAVYYLPLTALTPPAAATSGSASPASATAAEWRQRVATALGSSTAQKVLSMLSCGLPV